MDSSVHGSFSAGNIFNHGELGLEFRLGKNLNSGFGGINGFTPFPIKPTFIDIIGPENSSAIQLLNMIQILQNKPETDINDYTKSEPISNKQFFIFGRIIGRGVITNYTIDGSSSHTVKHKYWIGDIVFGAVFRHKFFMLTWQHIIRSPEYIPNGHWHKYNSFSITILPRGLF